VRGDKQDLGDVVKFGWRDHGTGSMAGSFLVIEFLFFGPGSFGLIVRLFPVKQWQEGRVLRRPALFMEPHPPEIWRSERCSV
jgi:hypothetical protein